MTQPSAPPVLRFGAFDLDRQSGEALRSGRKLHLTPQAFQLLLLLADRQGELVTREDIRRALWPDDTFVNFDTAVNACISQIRAALGDKPTAPRFIETLPRRGYRFVAPVHTIEATPSAATRPGMAPPETLPTISGPPGANRGPQRSRVREVVAAVSIAGVLGVAVLFAVLAARAGAARSPASAGRNIEALKKLELGRSGLEDASPGDLQERVRHFRAALSLEPDFAEAYAGLADAQLILAAYRAEEPQPAYAAAKAAAAKALHFDARNGEAHAVYAAAILMFDWNWIDAGKHLRQAEALAPLSPRVQHWYGRYLTALGRHDQAMSHARRAMTLRPGSPSAATYFGAAAFYAGDMKSARGACAHAASLMPEFVPAATCLAAIDNPSLASPAMPDAYLRSILDALRDGNRTAALDRLQLAANRHSDALVFAAVQPAFRALANEPRFQSAMTRVGRPVSVYTLR
jgi:DNA-binding winged helix-turn-helix (wHTH) protein/tetratricopeptide (TPR) repeat protein